MKGLSEYNFKERPKCYVCGREIFREDKKAKVKDLDKDLSVVYCSVCVKDEERNEEYATQARAQQGKRTKINFIRTLIIILAIAIWELSQKSSEWYFAIWSGGSIIIYLLFRLIDGMEKNKI